jgi:hypothetical protein
MNVDLQAVYVILREIAATQAAPIRYTELSQRYERAMGEWIDPHFGWSLPLLEILQWCAGRGLPQLPALVIGEEGLPGHGFWGQLNTPPTPSDEKWIEMCSAVYQADWPAQMN